MPPPNFSSDTFTAQTLAKANAGKIIADAPLISGKLFFLQAKLTIPAGTAINDTFDLIDIPAGVTIIPALCSIQGAAAGSGALISLGFSGEVAAVAAATTANTAGVVPFVSNVGSYKNDVRRPLQAVLTADELTAGVIKYFNIGCVIAE